MLLYRVSQQENLEVDKIVKNAKNSSNWRDNFIWM